MINTCRDIAKKLVNLNNVRNSEIVSFDTLLFPKYRSNSNANFRISEQESKILFANHFLINKKFFSVEVPTMSTHSFSGKTKISARFDLVTYKSNEAKEFDWIIELKAHNPKDTSIQKDLEKMLASNCKCLWFHTLKNEDKATIPSILKKFNISFNNLSEKFNNLSEKEKSLARLLIVFVVINKKLLYSTEFQLDKWRSCLPTDRNKLKKEKLA
ncbi:MAG: hypothetical protein ACMUIU_00680 [bacterium]